MLHIPSPAHGGKSLNLVARYDYFDKIRLWLREPLLTSTQLKQLREHCGPGGLYHQEGPAYFDWRYRQKLELYQPSRRALNLLAHRDDALLNHVEPACDLIFADRFGTEDCFELFRDGFLQPWHRRRTQVHGYERGNSQGFTTRAPPQPGQRRNGHWCVFYADRPCKLTGERNCFHFEGKHAGAQYVRRLGLQQPRDLLGFDFDGYFARWMRLYQVDLDRLGRWDHNRRTGNRRKRSYVAQYSSRITTDSDRLRGGLLYRLRSQHPDGSGCSLQRFVDGYGRGPFLRPVTPLFIYVHSHKHVHVETTRIKPRQPPAFTPEFQCVFPTRTRCSHEPATGVVSDRHPASSGLARAQPERASSP